MVNILILYPNEFNCYSKFERKVSRIVKSLDNFNIIYPSDTNLLIRKLFKNGNSINLIEQDKWKVSDITHAIIFDDGEVFREEITLLNKENIKLREIKIPITRVVNIKNETAYKNIKSTSSYEYIGRGAYWGNPYSMYDDGESREEVIRKYQYDFEFDKFPNKEKAQVLKLAGKRLGCFCKPQACHGDVLAKYLNNWDDGK